MVFQSLKKTLIFSVIAILCYGLFVSCENPFSNNLGSKVDIEAPTITVLSPEAGGFLRDTVTFTGEATAYRDLRRSNGEYSNAIQVMIYDQTDDTKILLNWTTIGKNISSDKKRDKTWIWTYDLDTTSFSDIGFFKIKFRVYDESADKNRKPTETQALVYIIKNKPSSIKLATPSQDYLDSPASELAPASLITGSNEITGTVLDRRGVKPGYPMIKFWPEDLPGGEPAGDHPLWGWASLFLTGRGLDSPTTDLGYYADRSDMAVVTTASFTFLLNEYWIEPGTRQIKYDKNGGAYKSLEPKRYRFRIKTSDTFFDMADRKPRAPEEGEQEAIGYYPDIPMESLISGNEAEWDRAGPSYVVNVKSAGVIPVVMLNNDDLNSDQLETPHIFLTNDSREKIALRGTQPDFRLQVLVSHPSGVSRATLQCDYMAGGRRESFYLPWDDAFTFPGRTYASAGYVDGSTDTTKAEKGHQGFKLDTDNTLTYFRYTPEGDNSIFATNTEYTLTVRATAAGGEELYGVESYTLYLDNTTPTLNIESVRGASNDPVASGATIAGTGGVLFDEAYAVNGNIQVYLDGPPSSNHPIISTKWIVEEDTTNYVTASGTMLEKLKTYRSAPNATNYKAVYNSMVTGRMSGDLTPPANVGLYPDTKWNLKFNTLNGPTPGSANQWNGKDLWLYIIAEDKVKNLGFVLQRLHVDDSADKPKMETSDTFTSTITSLADLYNYIGTPPTGTTSNTSGKNILDDGGIELVFNDDDGISVPQAVAGNITITVTNLNATETVGGNVVNVTRTLTPAQLRDFLSYSRYLIDNNSKEWRGVLSQKIMADALNLNQSMDAEIRKLPDGYYRLNISFSDNLAAKVAIERNPLLPGDTPTAVAGDSQQFFFAVQSNNPVLTIDTPEANAVLNTAQATTVTVSGKVTSGVKIQRLTISVAPTLSTPPTSPLTLYRDAGWATPITTLGDTGRDTDGNYVYYWRSQTVNLTATTPASNLSSRTFTLTAWDGLGNTRTETRAVEIDTVAPVLSLDLFNFGREDNTKVNGKVPIEIGVYDLGGVKESGDNVHLKWWVVPAGTVPSGWNWVIPPGSIGGQFKKSDDLGGGKYWTVFDTTITANFTNEGSYHLYAMAEDKAGNFSSNFSQNGSVITPIPNTPTRLPPLPLAPLVFTINQASDYPVLTPGTLSPLDNEKVSNVGGNELIIKGEVTDDDGFNPAASGLNNYLTTTYVQIRFPIGLPGGEPTINTHNFGTDEQGWINVPAKLEADILKFGYETAAHEYFTDDFGATKQGYKYYQIRISDEPAAGTNSTYYYEKTPHGKNPDGNGTLGKVYKTYPVVDAANPRNYYYFMLDNGAPEIHFAKYDPNDKHPGYNTAGEGARPAYNNLNALITDLTGIVIEEGTELDTVQFSYRNVMRGDLVALKYIGAKVGDRYPVNIPASVLNNSTDGWLKDIPFTGLSKDEGMDTIYLYARDTAGNENSVEWTFYIDNVGPDITFMNVNDNAGSSVLEKDMRIVAGRSGMITYIRGSFEDNLSNIGSSYSYKFDNAASFTEIAFGADSENVREGRRASWAVVVGHRQLNGSYVDLTDGPHTLYIEVRDVGGNTSDKKYGVTTEPNAGIKFVLDATAPVLSESENILLDVTGTKEKPADYNRVFSAAYASSGGTARVFTLSGLVYDRYLSNLTVGFQSQLGSNAVRTITLPNIDTWDGNGSYSTGAVTTGETTPATTNRLGVRRLTSAEITAGTYLPYVSNDDNTNANSLYLYVWELEVSGDDLYQITNSVSGTETTIRQITVTAQDRARLNSETKNWRFYLDSTPPKVSFTNADIHATYSHYIGSTANGNNSDTSWTLTNPLPSRIDVINNDFALEGVASDGTGIKEIRYLVSRSSSGMGDDWAYYNTAGAGSWTSPTRPLETAWRVMYSQTGTTADTTVYPTLNNSRLGTTNGYPAQLSDGLYRLELVVTDFSRAASNAGNAVRPIVEFFIDRNEPELSLVGDPQDFYQTSKLDFTFKAEDYQTKVTTGNTTTLTPGNGIVGFAQAVLRRYGETTPVGVTMDPVTVRRVSDTESRINVKITSMGSNPDGRYTLALTVRDRTGKDAVIGNTLDFYLDNKKPTVGVIPAGNNAVGSGEAITGRVLLQSSFTKATSDSPVRRVAFQLATFAAGTPTTPSDTPGVGDLSDPALISNGWYFNSNGVGDKPQFSTGSESTLKVYAQINPGLSSANILIPNTRNFLELIGGVRYMGTAQTVSSITGASITWESIGITSTESVHKLRVYLLAIDEADNYHIEFVDYWVYPEGDKPKVSITIPNNNALNPVNLFSGNFRISGSAIDNDYVKRVYFRVYKDGATTPFTGLVVPNWKEEDWSVGTGYQTAQTLTDIADVSYGSGWYIANGGGRSNPNWWAMINADGELDSTTNAPTEIRIEVMAEDSIWNDFANGGNGAWETGKGLYTSTTFTTVKPLPSATAQVVNNAPNYSDEIVKQGASGAPAGTPPSEAQWTAHFANWSSALTTNVSGRASYAVTVQAITEIGEIRWTRPNGAIVNLLDPTAGNYNTGTGTDAYAYHLTRMDTANPYNVNTNPGVAVRAVPIAATGDYKSAYKVVVDINSFILNNGEFGADKSGRYSLTISATDKSNPSPLSSQTTALIPIDNIPPEALYTFSSRVAGSSATFGGVAGDTGTINGLSRVVMWFSVDGTSVVWNDSVGGTFVAETDAAKLNDIAKIKNIPSGLSFPAVPAENAASNNSCVVIDRNDPMGNTPHHGHTFSMGFANTGAGALPRSWYAVLDSTKMKPGLKTVHFVVYDTAGNAQYYNQKIMVMNGIPKIEKITLATDIRGDRTFTPAFGTNQALSDGTVLSRIRTAYDALNPSNNTTARGISEEINIDTTRPNVWGVVYDQEFNVRNNLLAIQIKTNAHTSGSDRYYRFEYVSNAKLIRGVNVIRGDNGIKAGRVYIINEIGSTVNRFPWGSLGAQGETFGKGLAFLALEDGATMNLPDLPGTDPYGTPSVWELNSSYYGTGNTRTVPITLGYNSGTTSDLNANSTSAEFVYAAGAFNATGTFTTTDNINTGNGSTITSNGRILDFVPEAADLRTDGRPLESPDYYLAPTTRPAEGRHPMLAHSLFIVRVFDTVTGAGELFGDFALLSIRVNNNDKTVPYSQLYDLNPKTEGDTWATALSPVDMGSNRTKGGLYMGNATGGAKSGHIEPRNGTSLMSVDMGGSGRGEGSLIRPEAKTDAYFTTDTVSGDVIIRGYAEDDQRIGSVALQFWNEANGTQIGTDLIILNYDSRANGPANSLIGPVGTADDRARVSFTETMDLSKHRIEWAYRWNTESYPGGNNVVGNFNVRAVVRNVTNANVLKDNSRRITRPTAVPATVDNTYDYFNPSFPASGGRAVLDTTPAGIQTGQYLRYNDTRVNIRPYMTGFLRQTSTSVHNTRSRQGRYMFARGEQVVVTGFNLLNGNNATNSVITLPTATATINTTTANVGTITNGGSIADFGLTTPAAGDATTAFNRHYRQFQIPTTAATGAAGTVTLTVNGNANPAVNTSGERSATRFIQPWNVEYTGKEGTELWDDVTAVHIWQSLATDNSNTGTNGTGGNAAFRSTTTNTTGTTIIMHPAMSIDPASGVLYASHNEGGSTNNNNGSLRASTNSDVNPVPAASSAVTDAVSVFLMEFRDPIVFSDIYRSPGTSATGATTWVTSSIIGRSAGNQEWNYLGGVYIKGPGGVAVPFNASGTTANSNSNLYYGESTWYNASTGSSTVVDPATTDQFLNPHVVTSYNNPTNGNTEYIHLSYYDSKEGSNSIKYKHNVRNAPEAMNTTATIQPGTHPSASRAWVNLDGGMDDDDRDLPYTFTLTQARAYRGLATLNGTNDYLRAVANGIDNGVTVTAGQQIYTVGSATRNTTTNTSAVVAPIAGVISGIQQPTTGNAAFVRLPGHSNASGGTAFTITPANQDGRVVNRTARGTSNAGEHNAIAVTADGYPVIAYYDTSGSGKLKLAVSNKVNPLTANDWVIRDNVAVPSDGSTMDGSPMYRDGTGPFVSIAIDNGRAVTLPAGVNSGITRNRIHIAAMNTNGNLVYIRGQLDTSFTTATRAAVQTAGSVLTNVTVQVVDSLGTVGRWCKISIDQYGNPWIAYQDTGYSGAKDGVKLAYLDTARFTKGAADNTFTGEAGQDMDMHGGSISGWETMHVPTIASVENPVFGMGEQGRIGLECFPTRNYAATNTGRIWSAAVSYLSTDLYRIAYYVK